MKKVFLGNAFSLQMLDCIKPAMVCVTPVSVDDIPHNVHSVVGHVDTATVLSDMLGFPVAFNRESVRLVPGDTLFVAQVTGGRLPEGSTTLPDGFSIKFLRVSLVDPEPYC